jgi:hypothetical protein
VTEGLFGVLVILFLRLGASDPVYLLCETYQAVCFSFLFDARMEPRTSCTLSMYSTPELWPQPSWVLFLYVRHTEKLS